MSMYFLFLIRNLLCAIVVLASCSKKNTKVEEALSVATINNISMERTSDSTVFHFAVLLNKLVTKEVTIRYTTGLECQIILLFFHKG